MTKFVKLQCNTFKPDLKPEKVIKVKKAYTYKKKPTGEAPLFAEIWSDRGPYSEINNEHLGEYNVCYMAHILPKGQNKYPHFKLNPDNICIMSLAQHTAWDGYRSKCTGPEWGWLFAKEAILKEQYKILYPGK